MNKKNHKQLQMQKNRNRQHKNSSTKNPDVRIQSVTDELLDGLFNLIPLDNQVLVHLRSIGWSEGLLKEAIDNGFVLYSAKRASLFSAPDDEGGFYELDLHNVHFHHFAFVPDESIQEEN